MKRTLTWIVVGLFAGGCGLEDGNYAKHRTGTSSLAIQNAEGEADVLRTGTALSIGTREDLALLANTVYAVQVHNLNTGSLLARADLLTDMAGRIPLSNVAHDLGEFDDVQEAHSLQVTIEDEAQTTIAELVIPVTPHVVHFAGHGFSVDEVQPPHIFSASSQGTALNAFVVGALPDPRESAAPIFVAGSGLPAGIAVVDLYVVKDRDRWQGERIPQPGDEGYVFGPVEGQVDRGLLRATSIPWQPTGEDVGPLDILVDVDRNGTFDYSFSAKDGADGEQKVGLTIQYGAAWFRAKAAATNATLAVDAGKLAVKAAGEAATKAEAEAALPNAGAQAKELAVKVRAEADLAAAELKTAQAAATKAQAAFNQTLADDKVCTAQAGIADAAAKRAADAAVKAGDLAKLTADAAAASRAAVVAAASSRHLLVNLAYNGASRTGGTWTNSYSKSSTIYTYINPPVQAGARHAWVTKLVIKHQSYAEFWNSPNWIIDGRIYIADKVLQATGGTTQHSCTNTPPVVIINPAPLPIDIVPLKFDIVYDYDNDGYYDIGKDLLDVVGHRADGALISPTELAGLPDDQIFGFQVTP